MGAAPMSNLQLLHTLPIEASDYIDWMESDHIDGEVGKIEWRPCTAVGRVVALSFGGSDVANA